MTKQTPVQPKLVSASCPLGCEDDDLTVLTGQDRLNGLPGVFSVVKCKHCDLMRTNPRPPQNAMGFFYPDSYGPYQGTKIRKKPPAGLLMSNLLGSIKQLFRFNTKVLPDLSPGHLLEIGCASGAFLDKMTAMGWQVEGIEFSQEAASRAQKAGYKVHIGALESAPESMTQYDLVVGWMVIEHLHEPLRALEKLHRWVKPGGWLVVSVPNAASLEFKLFGSAWYALQLPTHLYHYTPKSIGKLLQASGWRLEKIHHQRVLSNILGSLGYKLEDWFPANRVSKVLIKLPDHGVVLNYLLYPLAYLLSIPGQTGRMTIWARKV